MSVTVAMEMEWLEKFGTDVCAYCGAMFLNKKTQMAI